MELNNFQLNASLISQMYQDKLIDFGPGLPGSDAINMASIPVTQTADRAESPGFLGDNAKRILILVSYPNSTYLPDEQLDFLTNILGACKLSLGDVAILNYHSATARSYKAIQSRFSSKVILLFGLSPEDLDLPVHFPEFQVQPHQGCTYLYGPPLEALGSDKVLKSKLWVALRRIFAI
jgi:hypothetical protein